MKKRKILLAVMCLALIACTTSQIILTLNVASMAISAAPAVLGGISNIPPATMADIKAGLSAAATALSAAATDLDSGAITPVEIAAISTQLVTALTQLNAVQQGLPPTARAAIQAVIAGVDAFMALWQRQGANLMATTGGPTSYKMHLSWKDKRDLGSCKTQLQQALAAVGKL